MAGFIPIALSLVEGDEILRPFSIAIIIGLFGSMLTTLILMPLLLTGFCRSFFVVQSSSGNSGSMK
jgi:Cu/Ag efflux pump CusA